MTTTDNIIKRTAAVPLRDAAFELWLTRERASHAVAEASRRHPGYSEVTLQAARMHIATSMR